MSLRCPKCEAVFDSAEAHVAHVNQLLAGNAVAIRAHLAFLPAPAALLDEVLTAAIERSHNGTGEHLLHLQARRTQLKLALADTEGQITSIVSKIKESKPLPPTVPYDTHRCHRCNNYLHFGWMLEGTKYRCAPCSIAAGVLVGFTKSDYCHHGYPADGCVQCAYGQKLRVLEAHKLYAKSQARRAKVERQRKATLDLSDAEEI